MGLIALSSLWFPFTVYSYIFFGANSYTVLLAPGGPVW